jgi:hypothetical protein
MNQTHHPGLLFDSAPCAGHACAIGQGSTQLSTPEESGYARAGLRHHPPRFAPRTGMYRRAENKESLLLSSRHY